jgi:cardiolipin synthase
VTLPNLITIGRLLLVPLIVWLILSNLGDLAFWVFVIAGVSDAVDGFLARQLDLRSDLGTYLDPIADKALLVSIYVTLAVIGEIPVWVTILIVSRDFLIVGAVVLSWMLGVPTSVQPSQISKLNTVAQILFAALVLGDLAFSIDLALARTIMIYAVGVLTIWSASDYLIDWIRFMGASEAGTTSTLGPAKDQRGADSGDESPGGKGQ